MVVVSWANSAYFGGVSPATLAAKKAHAEGSIVNRVLVATQVKLDDGDSVLPGLRAPPGAEGRPLQSFFEMINPGRP
ncbi:MAG: hypothetical protein H7337_10360 [Rhizobacter sp.]|nr:hypothetical protein [Rhizobacter sp.]